MKNENLKKGLYIGRFQPFHLGHLSAIKQALKQVERLNIGVGSSQYHHTPENPFTAEERLKMLEIGLNEAGIEGRCQIFLIPDIHDDKNWAAHVKSIVPHFDAVFVGNAGIVKTLFEQSGIEVKTVKQELPISATHIREAIMHGSDWRSRVSPKIANYLESMDAKKRLTQQLAEH